MKKITAILGLMLIYAISYSQPNNQVIASAGSYYVGSGFSNSYTIGEMAMIETFTNTPAGFILTQGFQQPNSCYNVSVPEIESLTKGSIDIYPNPSSGLININYELVVPAKVDISVYNLLGAVVYKQSENKMTGASNDKMDLSSLSEGMYLLEFTFKTSKGTPSKAYQKINLVY